MHDPTSLSEWEDAVENHYRDSHEWNEVQQEAEAAGKDIEEAWENIKDTMVDNVYSDLDPLVEGWIMRHGCQITNSLRDELESQEPEEDD
jgi:hypothetical protein